MFLEAFCQTEHFLVWSFHGLLAHGCLGRWQKRRSVPPVGVSMESLAGAEAWFPSAMPLLAWHER